jgi:hypothetical protein
MIKLKIDKRNPTNKQIKQTKFVLFFVIIYQLIQINKK